MNRRRLLQMAGALAAAGAVQPASVLAGAPTSRAPRIFDVQAFGAKGDGTTLDSPSINQAVDACHASGGGVVYLSPGVYQCGTIILKSNVTLYLEAGAVVLGSTRLADYTPQVGPEAGGDANRKHLIFARDADNVTLAGPGRIDGQGPKFWRPSGRKPPAPEDAWKDVATYDWKPTGRPSPLLEFYNCRNLRLEDVQIANAAGWTVRPIFCTNVFIRGVTIKNPVIGPNTDGLDITCSQNVVVSDCIIDTGDDAICLKSENPYGGEVSVTKNVTVTNCILTTCCNGFKIGTATRGGFENILFNNSVIFNEEAPLAARAISGIALEMVDGGWIEGVSISNIRMQRVRTPIFIRRGSRRPRNDGSAGRLRGVTIENLAATGSICTSSITGIPDFDIEDVSLTNIRIGSDEAGRGEWADGNPLEHAEGYPEARMFGRLPAAGLFCRHVRGLRLRQVDFVLARDEQRPVLALYDARTVGVTGLTATHRNSDYPMIRLRQCKEIALQQCAAPPSTPLFLEVTGDQTEHVTIVGCDLSFAEHILREETKVPARAVSMAGNLRKPPDV